MKILLVTSPHLDHSVYYQDHDRSNLSERPRYAQTFAPMGLLSIAGAVESAAEVAIADINKAINSGTLPMSQDFYPAAAEWLLDSDPDLIAFMTECDSYHHLIRICQSLKAQRPEVFTMLGGVYATITHFETLRDFPAVDFVMRSEGELAFRSFVESLKEACDLRNVGNLTYRNNGDIVSTPELPLIDDLDTLPWPDFSRIELEPQDAIWVEIGRGCPFKCNFCVTAPYWKRKHRIKSPARIIGEITYLKNTYGRTDFNFTHDLFTTDRHWVLKFCRELVESGLRVTWTCSSRTDTIDEEQIYWLQRAGCRDIYFGVETGTAEMQAKIDKNLDLDFADQIIRKTREAGIGVTVGFISGLPGESSTSLRGTLKKAYSFLRLPDSTVHIFGYGPYRGSSSFEKIKSQLVFDQHFADFPLPSQIHMQICAMMERHLEIFSRYSRMSSYDELDVEVIRAAEEYFPIINTLRPLMLMLDEKGVEKLALLTAWTQWIASRNRQHGKPIARLYHGTIRDFLAFLEPYIQQQGLLDAVTTEMIRWEILKDLFRSKSYHPPVISEHRNGPEALYTNPSTVISHFEHANEFMSNAEVTESGTFAFYARCDGTPEIVRLQPISNLVLDIAKQGVTPAEMLDVIDGLVGETSKHQSQARDKFLDLLGQLEELELLIHESSPEAVGNIASLERASIRA